jgi:hypothetical protein
VTHLERMLCSTIRIIQKSAAGFGTVGLDDETYEWSIQHRRQVLERLRHRYQNDIKNSQRDIQSYGSTRIDAARREAAAQKKLAEARDSLNRLEEIERQPNWITQSPPDALERIAGTPTPPPK